MEINKFEGVNLHPIPVLDDEKSTTSTTHSILTPSETATDTPTEHATDAKIADSTVPWPGSTFIIRALSSGAEKVLTLLDGNVVLAPPGGRGSIHWE
ncbi:hypothetical protein BDV96DRAFT_675917 [Lophiotrema nucula]|uniref:Uncharacterized protein n=1 Tax=Lophiotrema nucula TaxID=690887 RepID=A0A6A5YGB5_9PLEO|nr:hypothetical protein BDV96DRAFT_675917 [Lophiotrema nucula]